MFTPPEDNIPVVPFDYLDEKAIMVCTLPSGNSLYLSGETTDIPAHTMEQRAHKHGVLQQIRCRHPKPTKQGFDFWMNLDSWR